MSHNPLPTACDVCGQGPIVCFVRDTIVIGIEKDAAGRGWYVREPRALHAYCSKHRPAIDRTEAADLHVAVAE
jgi:hypothetical protein